MLKHEAMISSIRFYFDENPADYADYCAVMTVVWESADVIWLKGFHGNMQRKHFRLLLQWLITNKIKTVKAFRSPKHILPLSQQTSEGWYLINVQDLVKRFTKDTNG